MKIYLKKLTSSEMSQLDFFLFFYSFSYHPIENSFLDGSFAQYVIRNLIRLKYLED
jgi:hypothetical protein